MADDSEYGDRRRPRVPFDDEDERFTAEERREVRDLLRLKEDLRDIVEGKRVTAGVYKAVGEFAKWAGGIIAAVVAYKAFMAGGGK